MGALHPRSILLSALLLVIQQEAFGDISITCPGGVAVPHYSIDIVLLQDASKTFKASIPAIRDLLPGFFADLRKAFSARFGVAAFIDKPVPKVGLGEKGDYCYRRLRSLTTNGRKAAERFGQIDVRGGGDPKQNQLGALLQAALDPSIRWTIPEDRAGHPVLRIVALVTDTVSHEAGNYPENYFQSWLFSKKTPHTGAFESNCAKADYPSLSQVKAALHKQGIIPIVLAVPNEGVVEYYQQRLQALAFSPDNVVELHEGSRNIVQSIKLGLERVICNIRSSNPPTLSTTSFPTSTTTIATTATTAAATTTTTTTTTAAATFTT